MRGIVGGEYGCFKDINKFRKLEEYKCY